MRDLKHIYYILGAAALTSCADDVVNGSATEYLNGKEKTPITVVTNLSASKGVTRAVDKEFEVNDALNAYIKHVTVADASANPLVYSADVSGTGVGPRLANFKVSALTTGHENEADNWTNHATTSALQVTDAAGLYWDDFSNSVDADHDLRTSGHALMVYYGYGYNGSPAYGQTDSHISTALTENTGVLGWTVATDQTSGFKTSDLLYAGQQSPVAYAHGTDNTITGRDRVLTIPYTHAMSKVTIEVICDEGFKTDIDNFANTVLALKNANTTCTVTGPTKSLSSYGTSADVTMLHIANTGDDKFTHQSYSALIAPTVIKAGETFATITNVDGNNYTITLTDEAIKNATSPANAWSTQLATYNATSVTPDAATNYATANGGLTKPGVHYMLTVTIKKQEIKVSATIQDWEAVSATGVGVMDFTANIVSSTTSGTAFTTDGAKFNLWRATEDGVNTKYDENTESATVDKATTLTYSASPTAGWTADPKIYWPNNSTSYYFRALAKYTGTNYVGFEGEGADHTETTDLKVAQGTDLVWGTTADHTGTKEEGGTQHYDKGAAINPRTSKVPMAFDHAMSKISVKLESVAGAEAVNVNGAKISIVNIYDGGTVQLKDGSITDLKASSTMPINGFEDMTSSEPNKLKEFCVIPQSLVKDKDGNDRTGATTFYTPNDLTVIYNSYNSSIGTGESKTYVTSTLTPIYYTDSEAKTDNSRLTGAVSTASDKEPEREYTLAEYNALDTKPHVSITVTEFGALSEAARTKEAARPYTLEEFKALTTLTDAQFNALPNEWKTKPVYTKAEADEYNATLSGAVTTSDMNPETSNSYTPEEAATHNANLTGAVHEGSSKGNYTLQEYNDLTTKPIASINQDQYNLLPDLSKTKPTEYYTCDEFKDLATLIQVQFDALPETMRTRPAVKYTQEEADAYNAKLPGAKSTMDVHHYEKNSDSTTAVAGDIKSNGNRVVLHILLADNTGYTLDLATCKDSDSNSSTYNQAITTWERGKHYTYTITLGKEEITFRALIKDWEEVNGGGNATLDW